MVRIRQAPLASIAGAASVAAALVVLGTYIREASALVAYPWDWSPDEGLYLDWGRRAASDLRSLYGRSAVPFPSGYGPGLPLLLAPLAGLGASALPAARLLALGWTAAGALAVYLLVRPVGGRLAGLAAAALSLSAFDYSLWWMLVRPDGPLLALWLLAAAALLPRRLARGADRLDVRRTALGAALLLAACFTKPTAVLHGAPLVLGWLAVDRRSGLRLAGALVGVGGLLVLLLQLATQGAFLWVMRAWGMHATQPGLLRLLLEHAAASLWPLALIALLALAVGFRRRHELARDSSLLLVAGALALVPFLGKYGASWNYLLPLLPALSVLAGRYWALALPGPECAVRRGFAVAAVALAALGLSLTRTLPVPSALDARTARAFYGFVTEHTRRSGGPILATRPELAYFLVGQSVEMEGSGFESLARNHVAGTERILERLEDGRYTLLVTLHALPLGGWAEAAQARYVHAGGCNLSFYFGTTAVHLFTRADLPFVLAPPPDTRCGGPAGASAAAMR
jgi:hypothetical protein